MADAIRLVALVGAGFGVGLMAATNWAALRVLRPPRVGGFLWWHVTSISLAVTGLLTVAMNRIFTHFGEPIAWQTIVTLASVALLDVAMWIIFRIERRRYAAFRALR